MFQKECARRRYSLIQVVAIVAATARVASVLRAAAVTAVLRARATALLGSTVASVAAVGVFALQEALHVDELGLLQELSAGDVVLLLLLGEESDVQKLLIVTKSQSHEVTV